MPSLIYGLLTEPLTTLALLAQGLFELVFGWVAYIAITSAILYPCIVISEKITQWRKR